MAVSRHQLHQHQTELKACRRCPEMVGRPVTGTPVASKILLIGQAPGVKEIEIRLDGRQDSVQMVRQHWRRGRRLPRPGLHGSRVPLLSG